MLFFNEFGLFCFSELSFKVLCLVVGFVNSLFIYYSSACGKKRYLSRHTKRDHISVKLYFHVSLDTIYSQFVRQSKTLGFRYFISEYWDVASSIFIKSCFHDISF